MQWTYNQKSNAYVQDKYVLENKFDKTNRNQGTAEAYINLFSASQWIFENQNNKLKRCPGSSNFNRQKRTENKEEDEDHRFGIPQTDMSKES